MPSSERDWNKDPLEEEDDTETHLVMTGEGFRVEKRKPIHVTPGEQSFAAFVILLLLVIGERCSA